MKKIFFLMCLYFFIFSGAFPVLAEDSGRGVSIGVNIGSFPIARTLDSYRLGVEFGFQFTETVGIKGETAYAFTSSSYETKTVASSLSGKTIYTCIPVSASLLFSTPVGEKFSAFIGIGLGHYSTTTKEYQDGSETDTDKIKGFAPHVSIGIESAVSSRIAVIGEVKQIVGKAKWRDTEGIYSMEGDVHIGGTELKIGVRLYFK
jgi:opacity protein-like surface antigen